MKRISPRAIVHLDTVVKQMDDCLILILCATATTIGTRVLCLSTSVLLYCIFQAKTAAQLYSLLPRSPQAQAIDTAFDSVDHLDIERTTRRL